ncbi:ribokinase [Naumannella halotolerans]|uniref:ribokinase n=1 Tax=Naumannella halotolerans TaxID=993414 RepID=UPI00370DB088
MPDRSVPVAVVGTLNLDLVVTVDRRPQVGETVMGRGLTERPGGKGANQARATGAGGAMVGVVGDDDAGRLMTRALADAGVDVTHVTTSPTVSGRAIVEVDAAGDNRIVVIAGANHDLSADQVVAALDALDPQVVLTQLESPLEVTEAVAGWSRGHGRRFILNPSPAVELDPQLLASADPLVVNAGEARFYAGAGSEDPVVLVNRLLERATSVVMTLGGDGTVVAADGRIERIETQKVDVVDTTGAGDHFVGVLATLLAEGQGLVQAATAATRAATELVATPLSARF